MTTLMILASFFYFLGMTKFFLHMAVKRKAFFYLATLMMIIGFLLHTAMLFAISSKTGHGPYHTPFEQASFFAWTTMGALIAAIFYFRVTPLGVFVSPVGFLLMISSFILPHDNTTAMPAKEFWLTMHFTLSFLAMSSFAVLFAASIMYLLKERHLKKHDLSGWFKKLPDLTTLDNLFYGSLVFGFPLITVGTISAMLWSYSHFGTWLGPHPVRVIPFLLIWLIYAVLIIGRLAFGWRGHSLALMGALGFAGAVAALGIHVY